MIKWLCSDKKEEPTPVIKYKVVDKTIVVEKKQCPVKLLLVTGETVTEYLPTELYISSHKASLIDGNPTGVIELVGDLRYTTYVNNPAEINFYPIDRPYIYEKLIAVGNKTFNIDHVISYEVLPKVKTGEEEVTYRALEKI